MALTKHAERRLQQRTIPPLLLDLLYRHGPEACQAKGRAMLFFDEKARRRARKELRDLTKRFDKLVDAFVVESTTDGGIITAGHVTRRINRR